MSNTLILNLLDECSDSSLCGITDLRFHLEIANTVSLPNRTITVSVGDVSKCYVEIVGNGNFVDSSDVSIGKIWTASNWGTDQVIRFSQGEYDVIFHRKDLLLKLEMKNFTTTQNLTFGMLQNIPNMNELWLNAILFNENLFNIADIDFSHITRFHIANDIGVKNAVGKLSDLTNINNMRELYCGNQEITGDISVFEDSTLFDVISIQRNDIEGDVVNFGKNTNLGTLNIRNTSIEGSVEDLCDALFANGKITGSLSINAVESNVTYNGVVPSASITAIFTSGGWSI